MPETRWLSEDEQQAWRAFVFASKHVFEELDHQLQTDSGIPHAYYEILVTLSDADGQTLRMNELARMLRSSPSRLSHAIRRLEDRGWVRRTTCDSDARGHNAELTKSGYAALIAAAPGHVEAVRRHVFDRLEPAEVDQLGRLCAKLVGE